ncbi:putative transcription factor B3-Domain family [Helianthus debilis subsp. tardiflorus]
MFLYLNHAFLKTPSSLMLLLMIPVFIWRTNSGMIFTGKVLKVVRQLCMLKIGIGMLRWRDGPTEVPSLMLTGAEIYFKKVEVVVFDDSIYGDEEFDLLTASKQKEKQETNESHVEEGFSGNSDTDDSNFDRLIAAQIEIEEAKNLNDALKNTSSATSECHVKSKRKACRSTTSTANVCRKRKVKRSENNSFLEFTKVAKSRPRLPVDVSSDLCLSVDNLRDDSIQNLRCELSNMTTRAEKSGDGYRYGFTKWSSFLKSNHIRFDATLLFKYIKSSQLLVLTKVVHNTIKKRARA